MDAKTYAIVGAFDYLMDGTPMTGRSPSELRVIHDLAEALLESPDSGQDRLYLENTIAEARKAYCDETGETLR